MKSLEKKGGKVEEMETGCASKASHHYSGYLQFLFGIYTRYISLTTKEDKITEKKRRKKSSREEEAQEPSTQAPDFFHLS